MEWSLPSPKKMGNVLILKWWAKDAKPTLETCVASAVIDFNDGVSGIVEIFEHMSIKPGKVLINFCNASNTKRIAEAETQNIKIVKLRRKQLRGLRKRVFGQRRWNRKWKASYETGMF